MADTLKVTQYDLAAVLFHTRDAVDAAVAHLHGRTLEVGAEIRVAVVFRVVRNAQGVVRFGEFSGRAEHGETVR